MLDEKTRLYQAAVESRRRLRDRAFDLLSFEDDLRAADEEVANAQREMEQAWLERAVLA